MTRDSSAAAVYFALIIVAFGPFGLASAYVAGKIWEWFLQSLRFQPTYLELYVLFAAIGLVRTSRYVHDGMFRWRDALISSLLSPSLLLLAAYLVHLSTRPS
jgi:hypothetical protein